jgi:hypothetical protein
LEPSPPPLLPIRNKEKVRNRWQVSTLAVSLIKVELVSV